MITTSRDPSARLKKFTKEFKLLIPNSQRLNRGNYEFNQLMAACRANDVTDFIVIHEHRGVPDGLIVCHLPHGPTAYFTITDLVMRHDIPELGQALFFFCAPFLSKNGKYSPFLELTPTL